MVKPVLSVVAPCYNEEKSVPLIAQAFSTAIGKRRGIEVILVDNGSADGTQTEIKKQAKKYSFIKLVVVKKNIGYGFGIHSGLKHAAGEYVVWTHADLQTNPADVIKALEIILKQEKPEKCFVKGKRKGRPFFDVFFTLGMAVFESVLLRKVLYDINAQPNLFHRSFLEKVPNPPNDFSFDLYFYYMAKRMGYKTIRFPVEFRKRVFGQSHWNTGLKQTWKFIKRTLEYSIKLRKSLEEESHA
ncbi:glycosyltransferase family 2 protein [Candidatus Micrarchaeota archaeon]|nr:glycosyltransferase family 2 protein [Candidatus Micrarchaeota archaeon]